MQNPICLSTGSVYKFASDSNERIAKVREFNPDGIFAASLSFNYQDSLFAGEIFFYLWGVTWEIFLG